MPPDLGELAHPTWCPAASTQGAPCGCSTVHGVTVPVRMGQGVLLRNGRSSPSPMDKEAPSRQEPVALAPLRRPYSRTVRSVSLSWSLSPGCSRLSTGPVVAPLTTLLSALVCDQLSHSSVTNRHTALLRSSNSPKGHSVIPVTKHGRTHHTRPLHHSSGNDQRTPKLTREHGLHGMGRLQETGPVLLRVLPGDTAVSTGSGQVWPGRACCQLGLTGHAEGSGMLVIDIPAQMLNCVGRGHSVKKLIVNFPG